MEHEGQQNSMSDREVHVHRHSIISFDGDNASDAVKAFWTGACIFLIVGLAVFSTGNTVMTINEKSKNPEISKLQNEREKQKQADERAKKKQEEDIVKAKKQQYVDSCKQAGSAPSYMGDSPSYWECK